MMYNIISYIFKIIHKKSFALNAIEILANNIVEFYFYRFKIFIHINLFIQPKQLKINNYSKIH